MERIITVKGIGKFVKSPDLIEISIDLKARLRDYQETMQLQNYQIDELQNKIKEVGFKEEDLKTTNFSISPVYESKKDKKGNSESYLWGYQCVNNLILRFDFDKKQLTKVIEQISTCKSNPKFNIQFTLKNEKEAGEELLKSATKNACETAKIMCETAGCSLGKLLRIDYNWSEIDIYSRTEYCHEDYCLSAPSMIGCAMTPDDISLDDTATFVWEII